MADHQSTTLVRRIPIAIALLIALLWLTGCSERSAYHDMGPGVLAAARVLHNQSVATTRRDMALLDESLRRYLADPETTTRDGLQNAWRNAHGAYIRTQLLTPAISPSVDLVDSWPIAEGFLDNLPAYPDSGLISDITLPMTSSAISGQHQITDRSEASLGFHVLEYYAFNRPISDLTVDPFSERRRTFLAIVMVLMMQDMESALEIPMIDDDDPSPHLLQLLINVQNSVGDLYSECTHLVLDPHSRFSRQSRQDLQHQLLTLERIVFEPVNLNSQLQLLNPRLATDIAHNVREILTAVKSDITDDEFVSRSAPLLLGLDHQLHEFVLLLENGDP
jgi:hypothetical protein